MKFPWGSKRPLNIYKKFIIKLYDEEGIVNGEIGSEVKHIFPKSTIYGKSVYIGNDYSKYDYEVKTTAIKDKREYYTDKIKIINSNIENDKIKVQVLNDSKHILSELKYAILYYNKDNEIIGYDEIINYNVSIDNIMENYFNNYVDDGNHGKIEYDHYKVVINYAFYQED